MITGKKVSDYCGRDESAICYWKVAGVWYIWLPGCGLGNLSKHAIKEHADGTITASPSIKVTATKDGRIVIAHGHFTRGIWAACADSDVLKG